jgi:hypothetical protein
VAKRRTNRVHVTPTMQWALANALLWDVILQLGHRVRGDVKIGVIRLRGTWPVVKFQGRHYLVREGNPWPFYRQRCVLLARPDNPIGDLCILSDGLVVKYVTAPERRGQRKPEVVGVQDDIQPVVSLPVAGPDAAGRAVRQPVPGAGPGRDE